MLKKLSAKTIMEEIAATEWDKISAADPPRFLYAIGGKAVGLRNGNSTYGPWTQFKGNFVAIPSPALDNRKTGKGEPIPGASCFVPEPLQSQLEVALTEADAKGVDFAVNVGIKPIRIANRDSYEFVVTAVQKVQESDELRHLTEKMHQALPAPTPKPTAQAAGKK